MMREVNHPRYGWCVEMADERYQLLAPLHYGIRVIHFSRPGGENLFFVQPPEMADLTDPGGWRIYGGHRLWPAPEGEHCYTPDNEPVRWTDDKGSLVLTQREDARLSIVKSLRIQLTDDGAEVTHRMENVGSSMARLALWGITAMVAGGVEEVPFEQKKAPWSPDRVLALWNGADLANPQLSFQPEKIILRHQRLSQSMKLGLKINGGHVLYRLPQGVFGLSADWPEGKYPDGGVNYETFLCRHMVELETLSPLYNLSPGEAREHTEYWMLK